MNFDDKTQSTESVTAGKDSDLRTAIHKERSDYIMQLELSMAPVLDAVRELEKILSFDKLDVNLPSTRKVMYTFFR